MLGQQQNNTWDYFGYDGLGSLRQMTNAGGFVTHSATFAPYGGLLEDSGTGSSLGFTGEMHDSTGLVYLRARYADPVTGTFLTRDPVIGVSGMSQSFNAYLYAHGNPVNLTDPSGRFPWLLAAAALAIAVGVISALDEASTQANEKGWECVDWTKVTSAAAAGILGTVMGLADLVPAIGLIHLAVMLTGGDPAELDRQVFHRLGLGAQYDSLASSQYFQIGKTIGSVVTLAVGAAQLWKLARSGKLVEAFKGLWRGGKSVAQGAARWAGKVWNNIPGYANTFNVGLNPSKLLSSLWRAGRDVYTKWRYGISESTLKSINPGYPNKPGTTTNCVNCVIALDETLAGRFTTAQPSGTRSGNVLTNKYGQPKRVGTGGDFSEAKAAIIDELSKAGHGARGIIMAEKNVIGHAWNVYNHHGRIVFLDAQKAMFNAFSRNFTNYWFLRTK